MGFNICVVVLPVYYLGGQLKSWGEFNSIPGNYNVLLWSKLSDPPSITKQETPIGTAMLFPEEWSFRGHPARKPNSSTSKWSGFRGRTCPVSKSECRELGKSGESQAAREMKETQKKRTGHGIDAWLKSTGCQNARLRMQNQAGARDGGSWGWGGGEDWGFLALQQDPQRSSRETGEGCPVGSGKDAPGTAREDRKDSVPRCWTNSHRPGLCPDCIVINSLLLWRNGSQTQTPKWMVCLSNAVQWCVCNSIGKWLFLGYSQTHHFFVSS